MGAGEGVGEDDGFDIILGNEHLDLFQLSGSDAVGVMEVLTMLDDGVDYLVAYALGHGLNLLIPGGSRGNLTFCYKGPHHRRLTPRIMVRDYLKAPCPMRASMGNRFRELW